MKQNIWQKIPSEYWLRFTKLYTRASPARASDNSTVIKVEPTWPFGKSHQANGKWMGIAKSVYVSPDGVDQKKTNLIRRERDTDPDSSSKAEQL